MITEKNVLSTSGVLTDSTDMISVTLIAQGYARIGLKDSTHQILVRVSAAIEYIYRVIEITSRYIILITRHYMKSSIFVDYVERTAFI